jgi:hypothetical protein
MRTSSAPSLRASRPTKRTDFTLPWAMSIRATETGRSNLRGPALAGFK